VRAPGGSSGISPDVDTGLRVASRRDGSQSRGPASPGDHRPVLAIVIFGASLAGRELAIIGVVVVLLVVLAVVLMRRRGR
jgi:hypothetical protein